MRHDRSSTGSPRARSPSNSGSDAGLGQRRCGKEADTEELGQGKAEHRVWKDFVASAIAPGISWRTDPSSVKLDGPQFIPGTSASSTIPPQNSHIIFNDGLGQEITHPKDPGSGTSQPSSTNDYNRCPVRSGQFQDYARDYHSDRRDSGRSSFERVERDRRYHERDWGRRDAQHERYDHRTNQFLGEPRRAASNYRHEHGNTFDSRSLSPCSHGHEYRRNTHSTQRASGRDYQSHRPRDQSNDRRYRSNDAIDDPRYDAQHHYAQLYYNHRSEAPSHARDVGCNNNRQERYLSSRSEAIDAPGRFRRTRSPSYGPSESFEGRRSRYSRSPRPAYPRDARRDRY